MNLRELETPCLVLDLAKVKKNIEHFHQHIRSLAVDFRPHVKTVKNIELTTMALMRKGSGIMVSTMKEAEYFFNHGIRDIVYGVGIAPVKLRRVADLINRGAGLTLILDSVEQVEFVSAAAQQFSITIPVLIEIDCDGHRSGISSNDPLLIDIANLISRKKGVELRGIVTHAGESYNCRSIGCIKRLAGVERDTAVRCAESLRREGFACPVVSVGSTPTAKFVDDLEGVTEVRAGVFVFYDLFMAGLGVCRIEDIAISVLVSVIGHQKVRGWIITDGGWMSLSRDRGTSSQRVDRGYGLVCSIEGKPLDDMIVYSANQEHGIIGSSSSDKSILEMFPVGTMLRILPNHACATSAMHDRYYVVDGSTEVVCVWHRMNGW